MSELLIKEHFDAIQKSLPKKLQQIAAQIYGISFTIPEFSLSEQLNISKTHVCCFGIKSEVPGVVMIGISGSDLRTLTQKQLNKHLDIQSSAYNHSVATASIMEMVNQLMISMFDVDSDPDYQRYIEARYPDIFTTAEFVKLKEPYNKPCIRFELVNSDLGISFEVKYKLQK